MNPMIGRQFLPLHHILRLVKHPVVPIGRIVVQHARPDQGPPLLGSNAQSQFGKVRFSPLGDVGEVEEEGEDAGSGGRGVGAGGVVVGSVELVGGVGEELEGFVVGAGDARDFFDLLRGAPHPLQPLALVHAPGIAARPRLAHHLLHLPHGVAGPLIRAPLVPLQLPPPNQIPHLLVRQEIVEHHHPRRPLLRPLPRRPVPLRVRRTHHSQAVLLLESPIPGPRLEHAIQIPLLPNRGGRLQKLRAAPFLRIDEPRRIQMGIARLAAVHDHPAGAAATAPRRGLRGADGEAVAAGVGGGGGVGGDDEALVSLRDGEEQARVVGEEGFLDAVAGDEEGVAEEGVQEGGFAGGEGGEVGAVLAVVPVDVHAEGGGVGDADGELFVGAGRGKRGGVIFGEGLLLADGNVVIIVVIVIVIVSIVRQHHFAVFVDGGFRRARQPDESRRRRRRGTAKFASRPNHRQDDTR
mmetsp:Transcript_26590/g.54794  ORF Transcript_26590/g.54794 Transcript_26590/m.54794 type:complete len:465 (-) Transcript_26590:153-1547(-)